jgi:hypothetical protein
MNENKKLNQDPLKEANNQPSKKHIGRTSQSLDLLNKITHKNLIDNGKNEITIQNNFVTILQNVKDAERHKLTTFNGKLNRFILKRVDGSQIARDTKPYCFKFNIKEWLEATGKEENEKDNQRKIIDRELDTLSTIAFKIKSKDKIKRFHYLTGDTSANHVNIEIDGKAKLYLLASNKSFNYVIPDILFSVNERKYPYIFSIYDKLFYQSQMNAGDANSNILKFNNLVNHLLINIEDIEPKYYNRRISEPIEQSLNLLKDLDILEWKYCHEKGAPLTEAEKNSKKDKKGNERALPYKISKNCYIQWEWKNQEIKEYLLEQIPKREKVKALKKAKAEKRKEDKKQSDKRISRKTEDKIAEKLAEKFMDDNTNFELI